ncbi:MAG: glucoamylase family protein [Elusimicrobiota bacterium]
MNRLIGRIISSLFIISTAAVVLSAAATWDLRKVASLCKASSSEGEKPVGLAFDADTWTRWASEFKDNQWIFLDLSEVRDITRINIIWEAAYAKEYRIELSDDFKNWKELVYVKDGKGKPDNFLPEGGVRARYIRLNCIKRATQWGFSVYEFGVYGPMDGVEPEHGGLIVPASKITIYDRDWKTLDPYFAAQLAADPPDSKNMTDDEFLNLIEKRTFDYFWCEVSTATFWVVDSQTWKTHTSIAGIGFQLGAYVAGHYREYRPKKEIYDRVEKLLDNCWDDPNDPNDVCLESHSGWAYHWVNILTGKWEGQEHVCTHDSIAYLSGVILAKHYFAGTKAGDIAAKILDSVDWKWIIHDGFNKRFVSNAYAYTYDPMCGGEVIFYDGMKFDYILPIGGIKSSVPPVYWHNFAQTFPWEDYKGGYWRIERPAIWIHQWDNQFFDFRYMKDDYADYYQNSVEAALANRQWCIDNKLYDESLWGVGPSYGPNDDGGFTYKDFGAPQDKLCFQKGGDNDGTITPNAALGSIVFTPKESIMAARTMYDKYKDKIWEKYGFTDAFNPNKSWYSDRYISIDQGTIIMSIENYRSGIIWKNYAKEEVVWNGLDRCGFKGVIDNFDESEHSPPYGVWSDPDSGKYYTYVKTDENVKEAGHSLKVTYGLKGSADKHFSVSPLLKDFSRYKYLSFWVNGTEDIAVSIAGGAERPLEHSATVKSFSGWKKEYFKLPAESISKNVDKLNFTVKNAGKGALYLDDITLVNAIAEAEPVLLIDDMEESEDLNTPMTSVSCDIDTSEEKKQEGNKSLKIVFDGAAKGTKPCVKITPPFKDWRKCHSISMWVYGKTKILVKLKDSGGHSFETGKAQISAKDGWNHLFFNIQANLNPGNFWEQKYDKENIREMQIFLEPEKASKPVYIDSLMLTE